MEWCDLHDRKKYLTVTTVYGPGGWHCPECSLFVGDPEIDEKILWMLNEAYEGWS